MARDDYDDDDDREEDEDDEGDDAPPIVFTSMAFGRDGSDEAFGVIHEVCEEFGLAALRAHQDDLPGSPGIDEAVEGLVDDCIIAVVDLTHERQSVAHEIGLCDRALDRDFILLIAKTGTPRFGNIQSRMVNYYDGPAHLRTIMRRQLELMIEAWKNRPDDDDEEEDEAD